MIKANYEKVLGEISYKADQEKAKTIKIQIYESNCLMTTVYKKKYLWTFFADENHAKACLGLIKGESNIFGNTIQKVEFQVVNNNTMKLAKLFALAGYKVIIKTKEE